MQSFKNWLLFIIVVLIWGIGWIVLKVALSFVSPLSLASQRFLLAGLSISPLFIILKNRIPKDRKNLGGLFVLGAINALNITVTTIGLAYEKAGISAVLTYTQPLFVFCLAVPLLNEEANAARLIGIFAGFIGVVMLSMKEVVFTEISAFSTFLLVLGALLWAVSVIYYKKVLGSIDPVVVSVFQYGTGAAFLTPVSYALEGFSFPMSTNYIVIILFASVIMFSVAGTIWLVLLSKEEATVLASSSLIIPMAALFFGWLLLGESLELKSLLGSILILVGVYLVNIRR